jgi:tRNA(Ile)-lysidine synthase
VAEARRLTLLADEVLGHASLPASPLVVALSGGADSAALLWVCSRAGSTVRALHVDHGLPASHRLREAARQVAEAVGVDVVVLEVDVPPGASPEAQARDVRYEALLGALTPEEVLLTAHTSDDQAETVLLRLLRGAGPAGLAGIPRRRGRIQRPLLDVARARTRELATLAGLPWMDDPANDDPDVIRNRIRHELIPRLEAAYNPEVRRALTDAARAVGADADFIEGATGGVPRRGEEGPELAAAVISTAPAAVAARLARRLLGAAGHLQPTRMAIEAVLDVASGGAARRDIGAGAEVRRGGPMVTVTGGMSAGTPSVEMEVPGTTTFGRWLVDVVVTDRRPLAFPLGAHWMVGDADALPDLRIEPAGSHPELAGHLSDAGVVAAARPVHPVIVSAGRAVWLPGVRRMSVGWVEATTERYLVARITVDRSWLPYEH